MEERLAIDQSQLLVGVALTGSRKSKNVVKWAVENFLHEGHNNVTFKLIHVYPKITIVPTPMGTWLPASQVGKDVLNCYRKQVKLNKQRKLVPHKKKLTAQKIKSDIILLESDDIPMALSMEIAKQSIRHLVIGITSASIFSMKTLSMIKGSDISQAILQNAPSLCSVYVIENDAKIKQLRPADLESGVITMDNASNMSHISTNSFSSSSSLAIDKNYWGGGLGCSKSWIEGGQIRLSKETIEVDEHYAFKNTYFDSCNVSVRNSCTSSDEDSDSWISYQISPQRTIVSTQPTTSYVATSQSKVNEISKQRLEEAPKLKDEKNQELSTNKNKNQEVKNEVEDKSENFGKNMSKKKQGTKLAQEDEEIQNKLEGLFASPSIQFQKFTWEEIMEATSSFSDEFKIGTGSFGTVYKCKLHHTTVAIKVLHSKNSVINKQFVQELEILSTIRHPHLLLLLGAVPEESCLVYEYMDHGSLDDRLFKKNGKPPLPWYDRFRICYEVAGALAFLHSTTPRPIIHRDLKPANILLDHNLVSKIGDAGLGTMINVEHTGNVPLETIYKETSPVGSLSYIDPEYQRTGKVSTKSDTYALGIVILQMLTTKSAVGITYVVEDAINEGTLKEILDPEAGEWPEKETIELGLLGLECAELRGKDRPNLREKVLPILERLNIVADSARELASIPQHYFCPILKDMMEDPYVAADGYTYERRAIEQWLTKNDTSPTTNQTLPHKSIIPNTTLLKAIKQWNSNNMAKLHKLHTQRSR